MRSLVFFLIIIVVGCSPKPVMATDDGSLSVFSSIMEEELENLNLTEIRSYLSRLDLDTSRMLPRWDPGSWARVGIRFDFPAILRNAFALLWREIMVNLNLLAKLIVLAIISAVLTHFQQAWTEESLGDLVQKITFIVLMGMAVQSFTITLDLAHSVLDRTSEFVYALLPPIFALTTAAGGMTLATVCQPIIWGGIGLVVHLIQSLILPLVYLSGAMGLISHLAEGFTLARLGELIRKASVGFLGLLLTLFLGLVSVQGATVAVADGMALKTAKFVTSNFLPLVGGALSDTMEVAAGCSLLLKNALGVFGALAVIIITLLPAIKILVVALIYQLTAALIQPLGQERLADSLQEIGNTIMVIFAVSAIMGLMIFFTLTVLVGLSNMATMIRS